jgi:hypothetical protein
MDLPRSTLRVMASGIYRMLFLSSFGSPSLSLGVYSLFSRIRALSYRYTILGYLFPPILDNSRFP